MFHIGYNYLVHEVNKYFQIVYLAGKREESSYLHLKGGFMGGPSGEWRLLYRQVQ